MNWSMQLYSARNFQPWDKVLKLLGEAGYRQVEGFGGVYDDPASLRRELDRNGLSMPTGHFSIDMLETDFDGARKIADALGITTMICPYLNPDARPEATAAGWRGFGAAACQPAMPRGSFSSRPTRNPSPAQSHSSPPRRHT